jgi:hypothetical protein
MRWRIWFVAIPMGIQRTYRIETSKSGNNIDGQDERGNETDSLNPRLGIDDKRLNSKRNDAPVTIRTSFPT